MDRHNHTDLQTIVERFQSLRSAGGRPSVDGAIQDVTGHVSSRSLREAAIRALVHADHGGTSDGGYCAAFPQIDGYDIVNLLGRGTMGVVFDGYQRATGRRVAIKMLHDAAVASDRMRLRFEREVDLIARLQHPHIVAIIDSGVHSGKYYYVIEYVDGAMLHEWSAQRRSARAIESPFAPLPPISREETTEILQLALTVAHAVNYAHQRGVLHRDLKPSNIMVDAQGQPHVLDFGLAKAFEAEESTYDSTLSETGDVLGTLGYMSPEQADGTPEQCSVRSDVYSLGAITYELLTGRLPCPLDGTLKTVLDRIINEDPAPPSTLRAGIHADVDAIVLKALEKSRSARYATAADFAADLRRYLADEPIVARRASLPRRLRRWLVRHPIFCVTTAMAALLMVSIALALIRHAQAQSRLREITDEHRRMLHIADPNILRMPAVMVCKELLDPLTRKLDAGALSDPALEVEYRLQLANKYILWNRSDLAERHSQIALERARAISASEDKLHQSLFWLASAHWNLHRYAEAEAGFRQVLEQRKRTFGSHSSEVAECMRFLASTLRKVHRLDEAERYHRESLELFNRQTPINRLHVAAALNGLGQCHDEMGRYDEAEREVGEALRNIREEQGPHTWQAARSLRALASIKLHRHDSRSARQLCEQALTIQVSIFGEDNSEVRETRKLLAGINAAGATQPSPATQAVP